MAWIDLNESETIKDILIRIVKREIEEDELIEILESFKEILERRLAENAQLDFETFYQQEDDIGTVHELTSAIEGSGVLGGTDYWSFPVEDAVEVLIKRKYEIIKGALSGMYSELLELNEKLETLPDNRGELVILFDECIHAQHVTGSILDDIDIEDIKADADKELALGG